MTFGHVAAFLISNWKWVVLGALVLTIGTCVKQRDDRMKERAAADALAERDKALISTLRDSLAVSRPALDTANVRVDTAFIGYDSIRTRIVRVPYPVPGTSDTVTKFLVDSIFVAAADSVRQACGVLQLECARYRTFADSTIAAQGRVIEQLQIVDKSRGGFLKLLPWLGLATAAGVVGGVIISR